MTTKAELTPDSGLCYTPEEQMRTVPPLPVILKWCAWAFVCGLAMGAGINLGSSPLVTTTLREMLFARGPADTFGEDAITVLLLGVDANYGARGRPTFEHARSDVMILARLDFAADHALMVSIPRDTIVRIPGHRATKINAACAFGGAELAQKTVEQMLGVEVDHTVLLNFRGFQQLVDDIGGVWVDVDKNMYYRDRRGGLNIALKKGYQRLDGYQAMGYVRFRHSDSDTQRSKRQQKFLKALLAQLKQQSPKDVPRLAEIVRRNISGLEDKQLSALLRWGRELHTESDVKSTIMPTRAISATSIAPDYTAIDRLLELVQWPKAAQADAGEQPEHGRS
jgi:LCP family protein required for cell wall assembly